MSKSSELNTYYTAAQTAIGAQDWPTARIKLMQCLTTLAVTPNMQRESTSLQWRNDIHELLKLVDKQEAASRGIIQQPVQLLQPECVDVQTEY